MENIYLTPLIWSLVSVLVHFFFQNTVDTMVTSTNKTRPGMMDVARVAHVLMLNEDSTHVVVCK